MSRGTWKAGRPVAVWLAVTVPTAAAARVVPDAWRSTRPAGADVEAALVAACTALLVLALGWLWVITTATVLDLLLDLLHGRITGASLDRAPRSGGRIGTTRRLVLAACGVAVAAGAVAPASAATGDPREALAGLGLPDRAAAAPEPRRTGGSHQTRDQTPYVVRAGDSLWSIARAHPDGSTTDRRWRAIWRANRDVVGDDPDLIHPEQVLRLPAAPTPDPDGDRR